MSTRLSIPESSPGWNSDARQKGLKNYQSWKCVVTLTVMRVVLTPEIINNSVFWDVTPCGLVEIYQRFGGNTGVYFQDAKMEAANYSDMLVNLHQTKRPHTPQEIIQQLRTKPKSLSSVRLKLESCLDFLLKRPFNRKLTL
jgi:hypothetical protein